MQNSLEQLRQQTNNGKCQTHSKILNNVNTTFNHIVQLPTMKYIPYTCDEVNDAHWGCAWRSIQMMLSTHYQIVPSFSTLFSFFGYRAILEQIYLNMKVVEQIPAYLKEKQFAPHELQNGWAEPFIGQLILHYMGFKSDLLLINGYPQNAYAPNQVFQQVLSFNEFTEYIKLHFTCHQSPIYIDDGSFASVIYQYKINDDKLMLKIGDPHIFNNRDDQISEIGLFDIVLDKQGNQVSCSIKECEEQYYMYKSSYQGLHFNGKYWMVVVENGSDGKWNGWQNQIE